MSDAAGDVKHARQMLALEVRASRTLNANASLVLTTVGRSQPRDVTRGALAARTASTVLDVRRRVRVAAAQQFSRSTGLDTPPSGTVDRVAADRAGNAVARAWYQGGGGLSGGGGSTDAWDASAAREATKTSIARVAAHEVAGAWNDEHRRNAEVWPDYKFVERWCAILDVHLCKRCRRMNGRRADAHGQFAEGWPPLHPDCRCIVITTLV